MWLKISGADNSYEILSLIFSEKYNKKNNNKINK